MLFCIYDTGRDSNRDQKVTSDILYQWTDST